MARICCVFIRGKHPVCGEPLFCFSANPDSLSLLCGFHINHRSRSFLLQVSGISSLLSFCCTSLVSGFIIHAGASFVHSQTIQRNRQIFVEILKTTGRMKQKRSADRRFCALRPTLDSSCEKPLLQLLAAGPIACGGVPAECVRQITPEMLPDGHVFLDCDKSFGSFVKDFAKNGRKCQRGIMQSRFLC